MYEVYTLEEVVGEIRDERARLFMDNLPYTMDVKTKQSIDDKDQYIVDQFAKETGDFATLSEVDRQVIALGVAISREKGEFAKVLKEPKSLAEFKPKSFKEFYDEDDQLSYDSEDGQAEQKKQSDGFGDGFEVTAGGRRGLKDRDLEKYKKKMD